MTFVAFGALTVAAALPANADTVLHGSANAAVAGHVLYLDGTPQGETNANSQDFDEQVESYLSVNADASNWVDADGTHSAVTVNNAHAQLTLDDIREIIESSDTDELSSEGDVDALVEEGVGTLDETDDETGDDEIVLDVEFQDASVSVSKAWDGTYSTTFSPATVVINDSAFEIEIDTEAVEGEAEGVEDRYDEDITWDVAYNALFGTFLAGEFWLEFKLAEVSAGTSDLVVDDGDGQNPPPGGGDDDDDKDPGKNPGDDDDKDPGKGKDKDPGKEDGKESDDKKSTDDDLAVTGSPIAALIAGGAVIAAGGGAAAYLARRKKKNNEEFNETDES